MNHQSHLPYLICEIANSHAGNIDHVNKLIDQFGNLNFPQKGIKFQVFSADTIALPDFNWYPVYQEIQFKKEEWREIIHRASGNGEVWIDVFDVYSTEVIAENLPDIAGLKLQPSILENYEVLRAFEKIDLASKTIIINISGFELTEITRFLEKFREFSEDLVLQIGFQAYPTAIEDAAVQKIPILRSAFPHIPLAMADHSEGGSDFAQLVPLYSAILGCRYIEKHLCLNRIEAKYDGFSALHLEEMEVLCQRLSDWVASNSDSFVVASEAEYLRKTIQKPVLATESECGTLLNLSDLKFRRTGQTGLSWPEIQKIQESRCLISSPLTIGQTVSSSHWKQAKVGAIVACRMKSSRLEKKALLSIGNLSSVEMCLRQCLNIQGIADVILATSTLPEDQVLENYLCNGRAKFWKGHPDDVIDRYLGACDKFDIDVIVRVTADCPFVSTEVAEFLIEEHFKNGADYTGANLAAVGTAVEVINTAALKKVIRLMGQAKHSEYMTWYFRNNPEHFRVNLVDLPRELVRDYRLTLDYKEDLALFRAVYDRIDSSEAFVVLSDVFGVLDENPEISKLNSHIQLKYKADQNLINTLNEETKIRL